MINVFKASKSGLGEMSLVSLVTEQSQQPPHHKGSSTFITDGILRMKTIDLTNLCVLSMTLAVTSES